MRNLVTKDVFKALRLIKAAELKETIAEYLEKRQTEKVAEKIIETSLNRQSDEEMLSEKRTDDVEKIGIDIILTVIEKAADLKVEKSVYDFLSGPMEITAKEVEEMDLLELINTLKNGIDWENWKSFFDTVLTLDKKQ